MIRKRNLVRLATIVLPLLLCTQQLWSQEWSQWRGPNRDGHSPGEPWPDSLEEPTLHEVWRAEHLGPTYSSPVVHDGLVFTTERTGSSVESIAALEAHSGRIVWRRSWRAPFSRTLMAFRHGTWPRSTPVVDGKGLYFLGIREQLRSLDPRTGRLRWTLDFPRVFGTPIPEFGASSSPLLSSASVYQQAAGSVFRVDRESGRVVWRAYNLFDAQEDGDDLESYSSPVRAEMLGTPQIIFNTVAGLAAVDPDSGSLLWNTPPLARFADSPNMTVSIAGNRIVSPTEGSGTRAYELKRATGRWVAEELWRSKSRGRMSSPVVVGDHVYLHLKNGRLACLALLDGNIEWVSRPGFGQYASLVARANKLLILTSNGELSLVAADPKAMRVLSSRQVADNGWAHVSATGNRVYVRTLNALIALDWDHATRTQRRSEASKE